MGSERAMITTRYKGLGTRKGKEAMTRCSTLLRGRVVTAVGRGTAFGGGEIM